jgi:hypothetical protein
LAKTRRGTRTRGGRWKAVRETQAQKIQRLQQTPGGLLAGDRGRVALVQSTLSHLSYRHPHAYGRWDIVPAPPVPAAF